MSMDTRVLHVVLIYYEERIDELLSVF